MSESEFSRTDPDRSLWLNRLQILINGLTPRPEEALAELDQHGVLPLLAWCSGDFAAAFAMPARSARQHLAAREALHACVLEPIGRALGAAAIPAILLKGEGLALRTYPAAALRVRHDIDLWVEAAHLSAVERVLAGLGGQPVVSASGRWIQPERMWRLPAGRSWIGIDLHWQPTSRPALLSALPFERCRKRAVALPEAAGLLALAPPDALLLACIHRLAHHRHAPDRWIWRIDIALLWQQLDTAQREATIDEAVEGGVAALLLDGLRSCADWLEPAPSGTALERLQTAATREPARWLVARQPAIADWRFDLRTTRGRLRWQVIRDYLLPNRDFMLQRFADARWRWLPWLYLRRLIGG